MGWILEWGVLFSLTRPLAASSLSVFHSMLGAVGLAPAKRAPISPQRQLSSLGVPSRGVSALHAFSLAVGVPLRVHSMRQRGRAVEGGGAAHTGTLHRAAGPRQGHRVL